jgi:CubicO group peptidase (beta-lactamase class C family)
VRLHTLLACLILLVLCLELPGASRQDRGLPQADPGSIGLRAAQLNRIDEAVAASIGAHEIPGAVVLVARQGKIGYWKAFGSRALQPQVEPMTQDTIFDMASLTKVMATAPAIMLLTQNGQLRLGDRVRRCLPLFTGGGKENITVRQLLIHYSGLPADFDLSKPWQGREAALAELWNIATQTQPGKEFLYSDLNFIALGEIVQAVSGRSLDLLVQEQIYQPLGMSDTTFHPPASWLPRIAPTESSARDTAVYAQMLLDQGRFHGKTLLSPQAVQAMTSPQSPPGAPVRGFGWDIDTSYSAPRGDLFIGGYGHTGFTGTSIWIHPPSRTFIVILSNRVHPDGKGDATRLRAVIANIVASAID